MQRFRSFSMAVILLIAFAAIGSADAQTNVAHADPHYKVLHNFQGKPDANGNFDPLLVLGITADETGTIYGASQQGGALSCVTIEGICLFPIFLGTEFKLDPNHLTLFPNNQSTPPFLIQASQGQILLDDTRNMIFATPFGGDFNGQGGVFSLNPHTGSVSVLAEFVGQPTDGATPDINPIRDTAGNLYGTTNVGGIDPQLTCVIPDAFFQSGRGCGAVYKIDAKTRQKTILHTFSFFDGHLALGLGLDPAGNLVGSTEFGDNTDCRSGFLMIGCGEIFRIDTAGNFSIIHDFDHKASCPFVFCPAPPPGPGPELLGWAPSWIVVDDEGNIFGVTQAGGSFGLGVLFKIDNTGNYSVLHHFAGPDDGFATQQLLVKGHQLYGLNADGGNTLDCNFGFGGCGTIFNVDTQTGKFTVLHSFSRDDEGTTPTALAFDQNGDLIGSNLFGGNGVFDPTVCTGGGGCGNIFRLRLSRGGQ